MISLDVRWNYTAKRLCNLAQGCRISRLPWVTGLTLAIATPTGLRQFFDERLEVNSEF
jgi:hypothetical protein